jgi:hypothetical protein
VEYRPKPYINEEYAPDWSKKFGETAEKLKEAGPRLAPLLRL